MDVQEAVQIIDANIDDAGQGLPEDVFLLISRLTPLTNVDLLINNEYGDTLLAWRDDEYCGTGWHIPGGIIRIGEPSGERVKKVMCSEIGNFPFHFNPKPIAINEIMVHENISRKHFISMLFQCYIPYIFKFDDQENKKGRPGYLEWHSSCPDNLIKFHSVYRSYIGRPIN